MRLFYEEYALRLWHVMQVPSPGAHDTAHDGVGHAAGGSNGTHARGHDAYALHNAPCLRCAIFACCPFQWPCFCTYESIAACKQPQFWLQLYPSWQGQFFNKLKSLEFSSPESHDYNLWMTLLLGLSESNMG